MVVATFEHVPSFEIAKNVTSTLQERLKASGIELIVAVNLPREKWEKMQSDYQQDTLELRKQLVTKQMELETLWAQPEVDSPRVDKLSKEVADLEAKLWKKRDKYLLQCRQNFGDQGWTCPGGRW